MTCTVRYDLAMSCSIRVMTEADIAVGMRLKEQAGWNQTEEDWRTFLALGPSGCFVAERDGVPVGTVTSCLFDRVAWIGMMLVDTALRRQGVGTRLLQHAVQHVERLGAASVRLDATEFGEPLYVQNGFVEQFRLTRYGGVPNKPAVDAAMLKDTELNVTVLDDEIEALDREVSNAQRGEYLRRLVKMDGAQCLVHRTGAVHGFVLTRPRARVRFVGPCIASDGDLGRALLTSAIARSPIERVVIDVPVDHNQANKVVAELGLERERDLIRMCRGDDRREDLSAYWASSGPELG